MKRYPYRNTMIVVALIAVPLCLLLRFQLGWHWIAAWLVAINITALPVWLWDKRGAGREGASRVPEAALHTVALIGGTPASLAAMSLFRHKTLHARFKLIYIVFLVIQVAVFIWVTSDPPSS